MSENMWDDRARWEYERRKVNLEDAHTVPDMLDELGRKGWELVSAFEYGSHKGQMFYFKRRREHEDKSNDPDN